MVVQQMQDRAAVDKWWDELKIKNAENMMN